jgi:hypothetical protein
VKATIVTMSMILGFSMAAAAVLPAVLPDELASAGLGLVSSNLPEVGLEPLLTDVVALPRFQPSFAAKFNRAAIGARVVALDGEYFWASSKACHHGYCQWTGHSAGDGTMTFTVAADGVEGYGLVRHANRSSARFDLEQGKARLSKSKGPELSVLECATGLEESHRAMGARALRRMAGLGWMEVPQR